MQRTLWTQRLFVCACFVLGEAALAAIVAPEVAQAAAARTYAGRGIVKSFGAERKTVNIAHEKIEGYMGSMTMPFEARTAEQLVGINVGDKVSFTFTAEESRLVLDSLKKE